MNVQSFFRHWKIRENPFMAEEARQDDVFGRLQSESRHPDVPKIVGDPARPSSAVVFGEKGSGKTAIRLQVEAAIHEYNERNPDRRSLIIAYDELNPVLDRFARRVKGKTPLETLRKLKLVDHIDGLLSVAVPDLVDSALGRVSEGHAELGADAGETFRRLDPSVRRDWVILQALYDRPDQAVERGHALRKRLRYRGHSSYGLWKWTTVVLWVVLALLALAFIIFGPSVEEPMPATAIADPGSMAILAAGADDTGMYFANAPGAGEPVVFLAAAPGAAGEAAGAGELARVPRWVWLLCIAAVLVLTLLASFRFAVDYFRRSRQAHAVSDQLRVLDRSPDSFRASLDTLPWKDLAAAGMPIDALDDPRYAMLDRLRQAVRPFGFTNLIVLIDRIDEPTLVNGEGDRMKAVIWPLLNNKFLQQSHISLKLMLPVELRHELYRQSSDFFQEARLDKQNMIDRLQWSGAMLYDLCNTRLHACLEPDAERISVTDLFTEDVNRQDVVDALDQMRQPRDAFKMMYQLIAEHCASATEEEQRWKIPKLTLDSVRRQQAERLEGLYRGLRPA